MENKRHPIAEQFKSLWGKTSKMRAESDKFEVIHWAISEIAHNQAKKVSGLRNMVEIDRDIEAVIASKQWKRPSKERIPPISQLVKTLDDEMFRRQRMNYERGLLQLVYSALCDVVHPSWGGDFIYAPEIHRDMKEERLFDEHFKKVASLFCIPLPAVVQHFAELIQTMLNYEPRMMAILEEQ